MRRTAASLALASALAGTVVAVAPSATSAATPPVKLYKVQYDSPGSDSGSNTSLNAEWVIIKNTTSTNRALTGWTLRDKTGYTYKFPTFTLKAGATVTVRTGKGTATSTQRYYNRTWYVWNNTGDTAYLRDSKGYLKHSCSWTSVGTGSKYC